MHRPDEHPEIRTGHIGILLINLGSPDSTSFWPVRRYLKEFLSDPRVVEARGLVWWMIFNGIILTRRPVSLGAAYDKIWNHETDEAPLKTITRKQANGLAKRFSGLAAIEVDWGMRYANPPVAEAIARLKDKGCDRILLFPLYPQYSAATTATALDKAFEHLKTMRWQPSVRSVPPYFDHPVYIEALAESIRQHLNGLTWRPEVMLASFHGLPKHFLHQGDPYHCHCQKSARLLREALGCTADELLLTFQSNTGRGKWLEPSTEETITELAGKGIKNLAIITPGFAADCLETLEEIELRARDEFLGQGGENFSMVPCLNDTDASIDMLSKIASEQLSGWV